MGKETIMLSKTYKENMKIDFPAVVTEKLDGVPGDFYAKKGKFYGRTRQGEEIHSTPHILDALACCLPDGAHVIGELYNPRLAFSEISGAVRRHSPTINSLSLTLWAFDFYIEGQEKWYSERMRDLRSILKPFDRRVQFLNGYRVQDVSGIEYAENCIRNQNSLYEGIVIRPLMGKTSIFKAGWRSPGMIKKKRVQSIDLRIAGFEEAISKDGKPLGMVGRIEVYFPSGITSDGNNEYTDFKRIGVGPGKLSHAERETIWKNQKKYINRTIEVTYMPDPNYEALREARFYRFRPDKD